MARKNWKRIIDDIRIRRDYTYVSMSKILKENYGARISDVSLARIRNGDQNPSWEIGNAIIKLHEATKEQAHT